MGKGDGRGLLMPMPGNGKGALAMPPLAEVAAVLAASRS